MGRKNSDYDKFRAEVIKFIRGSMDHIEQGWATGSTDIWSRNGYRYKFTIEKEDEEQSDEEQH